MAYSQVRKLLYVVAIVAVVTNVDIVLANRTPNNENADAGSSTSKEIKKKTLSFEDELIEGGAQKPELFYLLQQKNFNYKRLIKLRENFLPEMRRTSEDVEKAGRTK